MIRSWDRLSPVEKQQLKPQLREIFFLSSVRQDFESPEEKEAFFERWTSYYLTHIPDLVFIFLQKDRLAGYIMGCADSRMAEPIIIPQRASYALFADLFPSYPAHLHINMHPDFRGQGLGAQLINALIDALKKRGRIGLHLITSPDARNVAFYRQNGFTYEETRNWKGQPLLFMGRSI
jgi:GNAT superfamily N-acetyltransferase